MKRLFLQFYISVLIILICTGVIHTILQNQRYSRTNFQRVEKAMAGGIRLAADDLKAASPETFDETLDRIRRQLDFPANIISTTEVPLYVQGRLKVGHTAIMYFDDMKTMMCSPVGDEQLLSFGPMPSITGPSQMDLAVGIFLVLTLIGVAIYLALRPIARQLRSMEGAILDFAHGQLETRVAVEPSSPILELSEAFNMLARRTENLLRTQRELLQAVSHELRTPLSRIHFGIDLARRAQDDQERCERLDAIEHSAAELDELVAELLRYVRMESLAQQLELQETPVGSTLLESLDGIAPLYPEKQFDYQGCGGDETFIQADGNHFKRAVSNLISNAGKYAAKRIKVSLESQEDHVVIRFEDDGPGIPSDQIQRVFDPFVRLSDTVQGVGLGLALVRRILERHQASIEVGTSQWGGAAMIVYWPRNFSPNIDASEPLRLIAPSTAKPAEVQSHG